MTFIATTLNHFRGVHAWAQVHGAEVQVDVRTFEMEVKARNRYFRLMPRFLATVNGRLGHVESLTPESTGMIGWLPYRTPLRWDLGGDKLVFKRFLLENGHRTPDHWLDPVDATRDFILKRSKGSFGYELYGPYRSGSAVPQVESEGPAGELYAEAFVAGRNVKLWLWGTQPFFAHVHAYPVIHGDGATRIGDLIARLLDRLGRTFDESAEMAVVRQALAYQQASLEDVLPPGREVWLDYRYGRRFAPTGASNVNDNDWPQLDAAVRQQCEALGGVLGAELLNIFPAPVLYSLDAVLDERGTLWWLEMNSNPILPPDGYPLILGTLFGTGRPA